MEHGGGAGKVRLERNGPLAWLIIDNPSRHNAINSAMWQQIADLADEAGKDEAIRVVILCGAGNKAFSAGADISEFASVRQGDAARHYDGLNDAAFDALISMPKPVIAAIEGHCFGGGLALALCCDIRVAAEGAQFCLPPAKLGIGYHPKWIGRLVQTLGAANAKELIFTGDRFGYRNAKRMGLINRVFPPEVMEAGVRALAQSIAENAPLTIHAAKTAIDACSAGQGETHLDALIALTERCMSSEDYEEGRAAFAEKRKPVFKGR